MEWNGGMENGMKRWMYTTKVTHVHVTGTVQSIKVVLALGLLSHHRGCRSKSSVANIFPCLVSLYYGQKMGL